MTTLGWTDRHGVKHDLATYDEIERERQEVRQELLNLRTRIASTDDAVFMAAHGEVASLRGRMMTLQDDLHRFVRHEATRATAMIEQIELEASFLRDLHRSYDQRDERGDDATALTETPTLDQVFILKRQAIRDGAVAIIPATFGDAHAPLLAHPATCRTPLPDRAPAFEWSDRRMHIHQVRDLRQIEREYVELASELAGLAPQLAPESAIGDVLTALEQSRVVVDRVSILEGTINRWTEHAIVVARGDDVAFLDELEKSDGRND